jgi:heat shock protein HslJ
LQVSALASTLMACEPALTDQDAWLTELLTGGPTMSLTGDTLTVQGSDDTITMTKIAATPLEGTLWQLTGTVANQGVSSLPAETAGSLTITAGQAAVETGCNNGSGSVEITDSTLTFGPLATTRMACPPDQSSLEATTLAVLDGEVTYEISGDKLSIRKSAGDGEIGLEYVAADV